MGGLEILVEGEELPGHAGPKGVGALDGLIVELLVLIDVLDVGASGVFIVECLGDVEGVDLVCFEHLVER